jgi:hypothetical protein
VTPLEKVAGELERYNHPLFEFLAREKKGAIELVIPSQASLSGAVAVDTYARPVHLHDYVVEKSTRSPQDREDRS